MLYGEIDQVEALSMFKINYVREENKIYIYIFFPSNLSKVRDLIEVVRPAGCGVLLVPADVIQTIDGIEIHTYTAQQKYAYDITRYGVGNDNKVGFSEVTNQSRD